MKRRWGCLWLLLVLSACGPDLEAIPAVDLETLDPRAAAQIGEASDDLYRSEDHGHLGMVYHAYGQPAAALACYKNASLIDERAFRWAYLAAVLKHEKGDLPGARALYARSEHLGAENDAQDAALHCRKGELELDAGRPKTAAKQFRNAVDRDPNCAYAYIGLGRSVLEGGDAKAAVKHLAVAETLAPQASNAHHLLGLAHRKLGRKDEAERYLRLAARPTRARAGIPDPLLDEVRALADSAYLYRLRGNAYFLGGRYPQAIAEYERAIEIRSDDIVSRTNLGSSHARLGYPVRAEEQFKKVLEVDEKNLTALFNLGVLLSRKGKDDEAAALYERAVERDPQYRDAHFNLANALARLGRYEDAARQYAEVVVIDPASGPARRGEARMFLLLGRHRIACNRLEAALKALPGDMDVQHDLARLLVASPDDEVRDGKRGLAMAQKLFAFRRMLHYAQTVAMGHAELGEFRKAIEVQELAVKAAGEALQPRFAARVRKTLELYRAKKPCRTPWHEDELKPRARQ